MKMYNLVGSTETSSIFEVCFFSAQRGNRLHFNFNELTCTASLPDADRCGRLSADIHEKVKFCILGRDVRYVLRGRVCIAQPYDISISMCLPHAQMNFVQLVARLVARALSSFERTYKYILQMQAQWLRSSQFALPNLDYGFHQQQPKLIRYAFCKLTIYFKLHERHSQSRISFTATKFVEN